MPARFVVGQDGTILYAEVNPDYTRRPGRRHRQQCRAGARRAARAIEAATLDEVLRTNLHPALAAAQAALPGMKARGWGRIVNISSLTILGALEHTSYAAAKAALVSFTRSWALELATSGIMVNAVAPGPTETELFRVNNAPGSAGEARYLSGVPMKRFGTPQEIAAAIAFLLSGRCGVHHRTDVACGWRRLDRKGIALTSGQCPNGGEQRISALGALGPYCLRRRVP
ncbi:SDR family oxidoreductase, partial [Xanthobacter sp. DSM 24535]|uniref:SDR family oxidoreductase n=1 Tax=Roseixanthobacter psychrophilus TaxID=3119917 RepID=UPI003726B6C8